MLRATFQPGAIVSFPPSRLLQMIRAHPHLLMSGILSTCGHHLRSFICKMRNSVPPEVALPYEVLQKATHKASQRRINKSSDVADVHERR